MGPAALALLLTAFAGTKRELALGIWAGSVAGATASGPLLGALLTQMVGWRSIFFLNVPIGAALLFAGSVTLPALSTSRRVKVDLAGAVASALGLAALVFGVTQAGSSGWTSMWVWATLGTAAAAFTIFVMLERRTSSPLLDRSLFRITNFLTADLLGFLNVATLCSLFLFLSLYLQLGFGSSAIQAGVALLPLTVLVTVIGPIAGWLASRVGARLLSGTGLTLAAVGLLMLSRIEAGWGPARMLPGLLVAGVGIGLTATPITAAAMEHVPAERSGIASATLNAFGMVGMSLGIAVMGAVVSAGSPNGLAGVSADPVAFATGIGNGLVLNATLALIAAGLAAVALRTPVARHPRHVPALTITGLHCNYLATECWHPDPGPDDVGQTGAPPPETRPSPLDRQGRRLDDKRRA